MTLRIEESAKFVESKAIETNLYNRLFVIAGEDIGLASIDTLHYVDENLRIDLCTTIMVMCLAPKIRLSSWWKEMYWTSIVNHDFSELTSQERDEWNLLNAIDGTELEKWEHAFFTMKSRLAVYFAMKLFNSEEKVKLPRLNPETGKTRNIASPIIFQMWNKLLKVYSKNSTLQLFYKWFCTCNENHISLINALALFLENQNVNVNPVVLPDNYQDYLNLAIDNALTTTLHIPECAIDMHTKRGRSMGKNRKDFAQSGSMVTNQWEPLYEERLEHHYNIIKENGTTSVQEIENAIENLSLDPFQIDESLLQLLEQSPRGQILTANWKPYVYLPKQSPYSSFVYKGPFGSGAKQSIATENYYRAYQAFKILGSSVIPVRTAEDVRKRKWLIIDSVADIPSEKWKTDTVFDKVSSQQIEVVQPNSLGYSRLVDLSEDEQYEYLFGESFFFGSYMDAALLGRGDMGMWNALVVLKSKKVYLIDYDNDTSRKEMNHLADVFSKNNLAVRKIIDRGWVARRKDICDRFRQYKDKIIELSNWMDAAKLRANYLMIYSLLSREMQKR